MNPRISHFAVYDMMMDMSDYGRGTFVVVLCLLKVHFYGNASEYMIQYNEMKWNTVRCSAMPRMVIAKDYRVPLPVIQRSNVHIGRIRIRIRRIHTRPNKG